MEEILASIRKIIADEKDPAAPAEAASEGEDVLELTQMVQDDGSIVDLAAPEPPAAPVAFEPPPPAPQPPPAPVEVAPKPVPPEPVSMPPSDSLVSDGAAAKASSALTDLANKVHAERSVVMPSYTPLGNGTRTLEEMVLELMRPMLKAWLDQNLPPLVEKIVQKEVERIARRAEE